MLTCDLIPN